MKSAIAIAAHLPDEHFVIRVDGRVKSHHRRFLDALREGLQLRDQFPQHDVKVQSMQAGSLQRIPLCTELNPSLSALAARTSRRSFAFHGESASIGFGAATDCGLRGDYSRV
jgi:hypothetical protein